uniref:Uncharacterized protein n=1 Tax=Panagrolaimus superbus TaxID=310955 RepID=A0A914YQE8_9BILA
MSSSIITLIVLDEDGMTRQRKRFAVTDDSLTVAAAIETGCKRLDIAPLRCQLDMVGQQHGSEKQFSVFMDDLIELGYDYTFVDPLLKNSATSNALANGGTPQTPTTPGTVRTTFVRPPVTQTTPTSSRSTFVRRRDTAAAYVSSPSTPTQPIAVSSNASSMVTFDDSVTNTPPCGSAPSSSKSVPKYISLSKTKKINNFYVENQKHIDEFYVSQKKGIDSRMFHEVDVIERFGLFQHWKSAYYILCQQKNPELYEAAAYVIVDACFDILRYIWPKLNVIPAEKQMLAEIVSDLTGYDLKDMTLPNRSGTLDYRVKHFRRQHPDASDDLQSPSAKRPKMAALVDTDAAIDSLSIELNPESDSSVLHGLYKNSASIKYDFNMIMSARRNTVKSLSENFRRLVPAIIQKARDLGIPSAEITYDSPGKLILQL